MPPDIQAVVLTCIDYRFRHLLEEELRALGIVEFDLVGLAGGGRNLTVGGPEREVALANIGIALRLHQPEAIVIANHQDCGAYGGSSRFADVEEERRFHLEELERARLAVEGQFPGHPVKTLFLSRGPAHGRPSVPGDPG